MEDISSKPALAGGNTLTRIFIALGILLRVRQYFLNRSLWLDESSLSLNIIHRSAAELLKPLDYHQGAPILFLLLQKAVVAILGSSELALRLVPLLCGIASIFLFAILAKWILTPKAVPIAVALFAISAPLIYYSSEVKQYSGDVVTALFLCVLARPLVDQTPMSAARIAAVALFGAAAIWFSQPAIFILAALGLIACWSLFRKADRRNLLQVTVIGAVWTLSFAACYFVSLRRLHQDRFLLQYWQSALAPVPASLGADAKWIFDSVTNFLSYPKDRYDKLGSELAMVVSLLGAVGLFSIHRRRFYLLTLPVVLTLLAAGLHTYPFGGRLILFLIPATTLLVAGGLEAIYRKTRVAYPLLGVLVIVALFAGPAKMAGHILIKGEKVEEIKPAIAYVRDHRLAGDSLYLYYGSARAFDFYQQRRLINPMDETIGTGSWKGEWYGENYKYELDRLRGKKRVWILFSHVFGTEGVIDDEQIYLHYLDGIGKRLDSLQETGSSVYLYDLSARSD
jgi:hypothetical protein